MADIYPQDPALTSSLAERNKVFDYVAKEDSPRSLNYQMDLMKAIGFEHVEILHKNVCFAAYCGIKWRISVDEQVMKWSRVVFLMGIIFNLLVFHEINWKKKE